MTTQQIRFCSSLDGVRIAYALSGRGTPLAMSATWLGHLEHQWRSLAWRPWLEHFSRGRTLLRYDLRGTGMSDRCVANASIENWVRDFAAVIDAAGFERFPLLGVCQGGPIAIEYAARYPERVSQLVLYGTYARGMLLRTDMSKELAKAKVLLDMTRLGWGRENHAFMQVWASLFQPGGGIEHVRSWTELQRAATSPEYALSFVDTTFHVDARDARASRQVPDAGHTRRQRQGGAGRGRAPARKPDSKFAIRRARERKSHAVARGGRVGAVPARSRAIFPEP